nr:MAG TPA: hypothetical protein [Caudoviricetes sp.]
MELYFSVLDHVAQGWESRPDDYYLTEISFLLREVFGSKLTDETVINSLRTCRTAKFEKELGEILNTPKEALQWILSHRMREDRRKACKKRYLAPKN